MEEYGNRYSSQVMQASWDIWNTCNGVLNVNRGGENARNIWFQHWMGQGRWGGGAGRGREGTDLPDGSSTLQIPICPQIESVD